MVVITASSTLSTDGPAKRPPNETAGGFLNSLTAFVVLLRENIQGKNKICGVN